MHRLLIGPEVVIFEFGVLCVIGLIAVATRRLSGVWQLIAQATQRLDQGAAAPFAWGLALLFLCGLIAIALFTRHRPLLGLLGIAVIVAGMLLLALGLAAGSAYVGRSVSSSVAANEITDDSALVRGFLLVGAASVVPIAGWAMSIWTAAAGAGAIAEALLVRQPPR